MRQPGWRARPGWSPPVLWNQARFEPWVFGGEDFAPKFIIYIDALGHWHLQAWPKKPFSWTSYAHFTIFECVRNGRWPTHIIIAGICHIIFWYIKMRGIGYPHICSPSIWWSSINCMCKEAECILSSISSSFLTVRQNRLGTDTGLPVLVRDILLLMPSISRSFLVLRHSLNVYI